MTTPESENAARLEAYLDGALSPPERKSFERDLAQDADLREQVAWCRRIDTSLVRSFTPPVEPAARPRRARPFILRRPVALTLAAAAAALAIGLAIRLNLQPPIPSRVLGVSILERLYVGHEIEGFTPEWVCETDEEFAAAVWDGLGQPMLVDASDPGLEVLGWGYSQDMTGYGDVIISASTMILLVRIDGLGALVVVDRAEREFGRLSIRDESDLSLYRRVLDDLVLYELTPLTNPRVLDRFYTPPWTPPGDTDKGPKDPSGNG